MRLKYVLLLFIMLSSSLSTVASQSAVDAHALAETQRQATVVEAQKRMRANVLCTATQAELDKHIDDERIAINKAINNSEHLSNLKKAMQLANDKYVTLIAQSLECMRWRNEYGK